MFVSYFKSFLISTLISFIICDNIDTDYPIVFSYQKSNQNSRDNENINGSYFGVSLSANQQNDQILVLVGATKYNSGLYRNVERSGAIFQCKWSERQSNDKVICNEIDFSRVNQFFPTKYMNLGSSLSTTTSSFVGCGHLYVGQNKSPKGKCFQIDGDGSAVRSFESFSDDVDVSREGRPLNSHLMFGFTSVGDQSDPNVLFGAPGYQDFMGSIIRQNIENTNERENKLKLETLLQVIDEKLPKKNSYLGYSMTTGFFDADSHKYVVMSTPRNNIFNGKVLIYKLDDLFVKRRDFKQFLNEVKGDPNAFGEYFGASVSALDINNDGFDDLVVGAPLYSNDSFIEVGRVYVFLMMIQEGQYLELTQSALISGYKSYGRFGSALSSVDINLDDFKDIVVGAPYEGNSDGSLGAVYIYLGSESGLNTEPYKRIGAETMKNVVFNGFGISILSDVDFDGNGYNDLLIGSHLSENAVLLRSKTVANMSLKNIVFKPNKIRLKEKKCNNNRNSCFGVEYCVNYTGKHIRDRESALITLVITDSQLRLRENRAIIDNNSRFQQKSIELRANQLNCFKNDNSFVVLLNEPDDIITPIELKLRVDMKTQTSKGFCKDCPIVFSDMTSAYIEFEHGCQTRDCVSRLVLTTLSRYDGQRIEKNLIEGLHHTIDIDISVTNSGEASLNTILWIRMKPILLDLSNSGDADRCQPMVNVSSFRCEVNKVLDKNKRESLNLHFVISRVSSNHLDISFEVQSSSKIEERSKVTDSMNFEIVRQANLILSSEQTNSFSYSDKIRRVSFQVHYNLVKSGPSTIDNAYVVIQIPTKIIDVDEESKNFCELTSKGKWGTFPVDNKTLNLMCDIRPEYCSKYSCQLPKFNSGAFSKPFSLSLALIPSNIEKLDFNGINFKLNSELKIDDKIRFETEIKPSPQSINIYLSRDVPIVDQLVEPWVLFVSGGVGVFFLIIAVIILIKIGFFRRKKLEEIEKVKLRMSIKPDMYDINIEDMTEEELNEMQK